MQGMASITASLNASLVPLQQQQQQEQQQSHFNQATQDDFLDQMLSSWPDLARSSSSPYLQTLPFGYDDSSRSRSHQISGSPISSPAISSLQHQSQQLLLAQGAGATAVGHSPTATGDSGLLPLPLSLGSADASDSAGGDGGVQELYGNGFLASLSRTSQAANPRQQFHQPQNFGVPVAGITPPATIAPAGSSSAPTRQKVRAKRGQATDPHSIAERLRRERIAERMKALQELVPNANKTDKASMLDEIIDYVKFLQLQVKVLSMSRLGGASAVAPLVADISASQASANVMGMGRNSNGEQTASGNDNGMAVTEHQVAKLMEEDMGSAMQYLQGKGLCLMPISLASAISSTSRPSGLHHLLPSGPAEGPSSPSMSDLSIR